MGTEISQVISLHSNLMQECQPYYVCIELCLWKGSRSIYGLLGGSFTYSPTAELRIIVPTNEQDIDIPDDITFLANPPEIVQLGLLDEYAKAIVEICKKPNSSEDKYPAGQFLFNTAAHGAFSSNTWIFSILAEAVLDTMCLLSNDQTEQDIVKSLTERLNSL